MSAKAILSASVSAPPVYVEDVFSTFLYTGTGGTQTITNGIDLSGKGGLAWIKKRGPDANYGNHSLFDTNRGVKKVLYSDQGGPEGTYATQGVTVFSSSGFQVSDPGNYGVNEANATYASWTFRKAAKFFDVVTYTGTGSNTTIAHNLGSVPGSIIVKRTDTTANWAVYHRSLANTQYLVLNSTAAAATGATWWNSTTPTSSVFSVGTDASVNASGGTYVAYLFAHDAGGFGTAGTDSVISCGSFVGNGQVTFGWEPQFILIKDPGGVGDWYVMDTMRNWDIASGGSYLRPNSSGTEGAGAGFGNPNATGWNKLGGGTYIYIAIRRGPMKTPTVGTQVFSAVARAGTSAVDSITGLGFPPDSALIKNRLGNGASVDWSFNFFDKLRNPGYRLSTAFTDVEDTTVNFITSFNQAGITFPSVGYTATNGGYNYINYFFRRAPGFFDVVAYTGTGSNGLIVPHNLGAVPELTIGKCRSDVGGWEVNFSFTDTECERMQLSTTTGTSGLSVYGTSGITHFAKPTATQLSLTGSANAPNTNQSGRTYIAYLFATCPGVSKVFNFTGTGTTLQINCGFTSGARLVLIKRTDSTGDWYIWDSARGIISGNDPYLLLNSTAAEVTNTDYIDPYSAGFEISSTAPAAINANGGSYIGLAIA